MRPCMSATRPWPGVCWRCTRRRRNTRWRNEDAPALAAWSMLGDIGRRQSARPHPAGTGAIDMAADPTTQENAQLLAAITELVIDNADTIAVPATALNRFIAQL